MQIITEREARMAAFVGAAPFHVQETSVDLTASDTVHREVGVATSDEGDYLIDATNKHPLHLEAVDMSAGYVDVPPGGYVLVETAERVTTGENQCAALFPVGHLTAQGLAQTGMWVRPGWSGGLYVALRNCNRAHSFRLRVGAPVGQLVLFEIGDRG